MAATGKGHRKKKAGRKAEKRKSAETKKKGVTDEQVGIVQGRLVTGLSARHGGLREIARWKHCSLEALSAWQLTAVSW